MLFVDNKFSWAGPKLQIRHLQDQKVHCCCCPLSLLLSSLHQPRLLKKRPTQGGLNIFWPVILRQAHDRKITFSFNIERNNRTFLFYGNYWNNARLTALPQCAVSHVVPLQFDILTLVWFVLYKEILPAFLYVHWTVHCTCTYERFLCKHLAEIWPPFL
jgi:hypothetical protein